MGSPYVGEIRMFGGNFAPVGWAFCDGQLIPIAENDTLFNLIGTTYGGDGQSTFALPNLQSRVPVHQGSGFVIGQTGGTETVTLTTAQLPAHTHVPHANSATGTSDTPANNVWAASGSGRDVDPTQTVATLVSMKAGTLGLSGGSQPHDNMVPFLAVSFIISLFGVFPSQT